jgi:guanylate kinase
MNKLIVIAAPSGCGKITIVRKLLKTGLDLELSISYTTRKLRGTEINGINYIFISPEEFKDKIQNNELLEYEEVYTDKYYGTSKIDIKTILEKGNVPIFDVDVFCGIKLKKLFNDEVLTIFILPPSIEELRRRLVSRNTDTIEQIEQRLSKAEFEIENSNNFDLKIINDNFDECYNEIYLKIKNFINTDRLKYFYKYNKFIFN